jgi:tRNA dimethylallyltransferase
VGEESQQSDPPPLIVILGPTAVGKTEISIQVAEKLDGEIVSADSRLFYRGMDIGTAKPTQKVRARVPHHLIDVAEPDQPWSLALFQQEACQVIAEIHARGKLPLLVGGTGQYIRAVIQGWKVPEVEPRPGLRAALEHWTDEIGSEGLHARLRQLDVKAADAIDARNTRRTIRALEVILTSGRPFSELRQSQPSPYRLLLLGLTRPRSELYARIDARIQAMLEGGLVEEVQALLDKGYTSELPTLSAIGYREMLEYLHGKISLDEAAQRMRRATRTFVRRQANWFKPDDPQIHWFSVDQDTPNELVYTIRSFLTML